MRQRWEYQALYINYPVLNETLNRHGDEGWELITCQLVDEGMESTWYVVMKREAAIV
jgi:hypothetical protein